MAGFREKFIRYDFISYFIPLRFWIKLSKHKRIIPVYHTVSNENLKHIKHLYLVKTEKVFERDIDFLLKHYESIGIHDFLTNERENKNAKKKQFLLTFDDGLAEFYHIIAPILKKKNISAICFLNSDFIDNKNLFYRYKVSLLIEQFETNPTLLENKQVKAWESQFPPSNTLSETLLSLNYDNIPQIDALAGYIGYSFQAYLDENKPYLTSEQINELITDGFFFGSHSKDHPEYQFISEEMQLNQTIESTDFIQQRFNLSYSVFAFPFTDYGVRKSFFENLRLQKPHDFTFGCAGLKEDLIPNHLQRIPFELTKFSGEKILKSEYFYAFLKGLFNKQKRND